MALYGRARAGQRGDTGASQEATRDYISFIKGRFEQAARVLLGEEPWMAPPEHPYEPGKLGWDAKDPTVVPEFRRQQADWLAWYKQFGETPMGWIWGYDEVAGFDRNLSRVLERARKAGADISRIPAGRATDPLYKGEADEEKSALGEVVQILKWGVLGYLAIQIVGAVKK